MGQFLYLRLVLVNDACLRNSCAQSCTYKECAKVLWALEYHEARQEQGTGRERASGATGPGRVVTWQPLLTILRRNLLVQLLL